jgi:hypothetical protein
MYLFTKFGTDLCLSNNSILYLEMEVFSVRLSTN